MANYYKSLVAYISEIPAGVVRQDDNGQFEFTYYDDYDSTPLSLSMPVTNDTYKSNVVLPYLMGLLPDAREQREALANRHDIPPNNPVALLNVIGLDCPGAVSFIPFVGREGRASDIDEYVPLSPEDIGSDLRRIGANENASWQLPAEHWSLGGTQSKIALARFEGRWYRCEGDAATTHIIKPGIKRLHYEALNECVCQNIAIACGLPASKTDYARFGGMSALVSERFDRVIEAPGKVRRLHQEDLCQALSIHPDNKYPNEGGPSPSSILHLLAGHENGQENIIAFTLQLFFNYLIGAPDAHGKNYSVLLDGKDVKLAPLYDCASALAYDGDEVTMRAAMAIGGERRFFKLGKRNVLKYAEQARLSNALCLQLMLGLAENIQQELDGAFAQFEEFEGIRELAMRMKPNITRNCRNVIHNLTRG